MRQPIYGHPTDYINVNRADEVLDALAALGWRLVGVPERIEEEN
jgi:hypothetical protein